MTKAEYIVRFQRLIGRRALWPFGFHCTGMPIASAALKLKREIEKFGPQGPHHAENQETSSTSTASAHSENETKKVHVIAMIII